MSSAHSCWSWWSLIVQITLNICSVCPHYTPNWSLHKTSPQAVQASSVFVPSLETERRSNNIYRNIFALRSPSAIPLSTVFAWNLHQLMFLPRSAQWSIPFESHYLWCFAPTLVRISWCNGNDWPTSLQSAREQWNLHICNSNFRGGGGGGFADFIND